MVSESEGLFVCFTCGSMPKWHRNGAECDCPDGGCMENWIAVIPRERLGRLEEQIEAIKEAAIRFGVNDEVAAAIAHAEVVVRGGARGRL